MTREEAKAAAKAMPRLEALVHFRNQVVDVEWKGLDVILENGKCGIGNPEAIAIAKKALLEKLDADIEKEMSAGRATQGSAQ